MSESKERFLTNNIISMMSVIMPQIQSSLIKKIKIGRPEHSLNPHPLRPITSHFSLCLSLSLSVSLCLALSLSLSLSLPTAIPLKVEVICVSPLIYIQSSYSCLGRLYLSEISLLLFGLILTICYGYLIHMYSNLFCIQPLLAFFTLICLWKFCLEQTTIRWAI